MRRNLFRLLCLADTFSLCLIPTIKIKILYFTVHYCTSSRLLERLSLLLERRRCLSRRLSLSLLLLRFRSLSRLLLLVLFLLLLSRSRDRDRSFRGENSFLGDLERLLSRLNTDVSFWFHSQLVISTKFAIFDFLHFAIQAICDFSQSLCFRKWK